MTRHHRPTGDRAGSRLISLLVSIDGGVFRYCPVAEYGIAVPGGYSSNFRSVRRLRVVVSALKRGFALCFPKVLPTVEPFVTSQ